LARGTKACSRFDEKLTVVIVLAQGVLIAPPRPVRGVVNILGQLASGVTQARRWAFAHVPAGQCSSVRTADHGPEGGGVVAARRRRWRLKKQTRGQLQVWGAVAALAAVVRVAEGMLPAGSR
jgi:hypothetical protein